MAKDPDKADKRWARTRERLLQGGRKAFARNGVEGTSVLEIVRAAGVSQPSFYNHFASKDELAQEIAADFFRRDRLIKQDIFDRIEDPAEAIAINIYQTLSIAAKDPIIAWVLIRSESLRDLVISSDKDPLVRMINTGQRQGRFVVADAHTTALTIRGAALGIVQALLNDTAGKQAVQHFQALVLRMLGLDPEESERVVAAARLTLDKQNHLAA